MRALQPLLRFGLVAAALVACDMDNDDYDDTRERGDLGRGRFVYACLADGDTACAKSDEPSLPQAVAVGGLFDVRFAIESGPQPTVISPARDLVRHSDAGFRVERAGTFALLAVNGNREVIDLKHMRGAEIDEVRVLEAGEALPSRSVELERGQTLELLAQPYDASSVLLAGALDYSWTSSDEAVVEVVSVTDFSRVRLRARGDGRTTLRVEVAGASFDVTVRVGDGIADEEEADAGLAQDAEVDTDAQAEGDAEIDVDAETDGGVS